MSHTRVRILLSTLAGAPFPETPSRELQAPRDDGEVRHRVLVVGSDERLLGFVTQALDAFSPGFQVATARAPEEAWRWMEVFRPEVIILDGDLATEPDSERWLEAMHSASVMVLGTEPPYRLPGVTMLAKPLRLPSLLSVMREVTW